MWNAALIIAVVIGVLAGLAVLCGLYLLLRAAMRRQAPPPREPEVNNIHIDDIWRAWRRGGLAPAAAFADDTPGQDLDDAALRAVHEELKKTERRILSDADPLTALRVQIMDGIDRRILQTEALSAPGTAHAGALKGATDIDRGLAADALRIRLLRYYGAARFGDRAENDWYDVYEQAAELKRKSLRDFVRPSTSGAGPGGYQKSMVVNEELRRRLLETPPGTSIPRKKRRFAQN
jgi:hypothetical protein